MTLQHRPGHVEDVREADATGSASSTAEHSAKRSAALLKIQQREFLNTQPFNDVVIGCASLKYFQQNSATLPKPIRKAECESQDAEIVSSLRKIACVVPEFPWPPAAVRRPTVPARQSSWTSPT